MKHEPKMSLYRGVDGEPLYTAADLKAARLETVERCMLAGLEYMYNPQNAGLLYRGGLDGFIAVFKKLKEEINEG